MQIDGFVSRAHGAHGLARKQAARDHSKFFELKMFGVGRGRVDETTRRVCEVTTRPRVSSFVW